MNEIDEFILTLNAIVDHCISRLLNYEGMVSVDEAVDSVNCHLTGDVVDIAITDELGDTIGYALHGIQSTCVAIEAGRHINKVLAVVEDGTLTFLPTE